jgi:hypothetical protein
MDADKHERLKRIVGLQTATWTFARSGARTAAITMRECGDPRGVSSMP